MSNGDVAQLFQRVGAAGFRPHFQAPGPLSIKPGCWQHPLRSCCAGPKGGQPFTPTKPSVKRYDWTISYTKAAPDCFEKNVVVVNGKFQPTIRVSQLRFAYTAALTAALRCDAAPHTCIAQSLKMHSLSCTSLPMQVKRGQILEASQCTLLSVHGACCLLMRRM